MPSGCSIQNQKSKIQNPSNQPDAKPAAKKPFTPWGLQLLEVVKRKPAAG
jgi:hypothetical protein